MNERDEVLLYEGDGLMSADELTICKNAVCLIRCETRCPITGKRLMKRGSGFYAKAKIFNVEYCCIVTNNHVISCEEDASKAVAIFHFEQQNQGVAVHLRPNIRFRTNQVLDYSVIGINQDELNSLNPQVFPIEYTTQPQAKKGDDIFIFQHPMGRPKEFSYQKILHFKHPFVYYAADTDDGSSGSPVLWQLQLMAVHRVGSKEDGYNKGTLFSAIINDLHLGYNNINHFTGINTKQGLSNCVSSNTPQEMEENSSETMNSDDALEDEMCSANMLDEKAPLPLDNETLTKLSDDCCTFYEPLGRRLGVRHEKIMEIRKDNNNYGSLPEKCFQMFYEWKESNPKQFTSQYLADTLRSMGKNTLVKTYFGNN